MPNRYLREAFIESEAVNAVSWQAEVTWLRLIVSVDDFGRCEANPRLLRPKLFPLKIDRVREAELSRWIAECENAKLLHLYEVDGKQYLQMLRWEKGRAENSKYPNPPALVNGSLQPYTKVSGGIRIPPTPIPTPINDTDSDNFCPSEVVKEPVAGPQEIYAAYPRKDGRQEALKAIGKVLIKLLGELEPRDGEWLLERTKAYAAAVSRWPAGDEQYIPMASTWFNKGRYEDPLSSWERVASSTGKRSAFA